MRVELMRWVKFIIVVWPVIAFIPILVFFVVFHRPLRQILERFNCEDIASMKIGPIEFVKQRRPKRTRTCRGKKNHSTRH